MVKVYIGYIGISPAVAAKICGKGSRGITPDEVREACQAPAKLLSARWHWSTVHGRRLLVVGKTDAGRHIKAILEPVDIRDGTWRLRTALVATKGDIS